MSETTNYETLVVFHGTSDVNLPSIMRDGLRTPFVTDDPIRARYYAVEAAESMGGSPCVLRLRVPRAAMRYDRAAMEEPVLADDADRDAAWERAAREHPEWVQDGFLRVPLGAFEVSWIGVGSALVAGVVLPTAIEVLA